MGVKSHNIRLSDTETENITPFPSLHQSKHAWLLWISQCKLKNNFVSCLCNLDRLFFFFFLNWRIITLQCCINVCCTTTWIRHMYTYIFLVPKYPFYLLLFSTKRQILTFKIEIIGINFWEIPHTPPEYKSHPWSLCIYRRLNSTS